MTTVLRSFTKAMGPDQDFIEGIHLMRDGDVRTFCDKDAYAPDWRRQVGCRDFNSLRDEPDEAFFCPTCSGRLRSLTDKS
jgi:hypothetical protein